MLHKHKLNQASRILARGLMPLYAYFPKENLQEAFFRAQEEDKVPDFFRKECTHLPLERRNQLAKYYKLNNQHEGLAIEREKEILMNDLSDLEGYTQASNQGIIQAYLYLKSEYKYSPQPNQQKVLQLIEKELLLIEEHADLILSMDPELAILKQFDELPKERESDAEMNAILEKGNLLQLGTTVLRRLAPTADGQVLDLPEAIKPKLLSAFFQRIAYYLRMDKDLSDSEKERISNNSNLLLEYLSSSGESYDLAFSALAFERLPADFKQTPEYIGVLWRLGSKYLDSNLNTDLDYEALLRLYLFLEQMESKLEQAFNLSDKIDIGIFRTVLHNQLGDIYEHFWEHQKAIEQYRTVLRLGKKYNELKAINGGIHKIIECHLRFFRKETALEAILATLNGNASYFGLDHLDIEDALRKTLDMQLLTLLDELGLHDGAYRKILRSITSTLGVTIKELLTGLKNDSISDDLMASIQQTMSDFYEKDLDGFFGKEIKPNEQADRILTPLSFVDIPLKEYETKISSLTSIEANLTQDWRLLLDLHKAKLVYLQNESHAIAMFRGLAPKMKMFPSFFSFTKISYWLTQQLRAMSLQPNNATLYPEIEQLTFAAVNKIIERFFQDVGEQQSQVVAASELENIYKALLQIISVTSNKQFDTQLLTLLWNVLQYKQRFFKNHFGKNYVSIPVEHTHNQQFEEIRALLYDYRVNRRIEQIEGIQQAVFRLRKNEYPFLRKRMLMEKCSIPSTPSILIHFFMEHSGQRMVLFLFFNPDINGGEFAYGFEDSFEEIQQAIYDVQYKQGIQWKGLPNIISEEAMMAKFNDIFVPILDVLNLNNKQTTPLHIYPDSTLHLFPFENIYRQQGQPIGQFLPIGQVLNKSQNAKPLDLRRGIVMLTEIPAIKPTFSFLGHTKEEGEQIASIFRKEGIPTHHLRDRQANIIELKKAIKQAPSILHIAAHGDADASLPPECISLILAQADEDPKSVFLTYHDIMGLDLSRTELVVLSACNSTVGKINKSAGIQGLTFAFLVAGASYVVASRIPVRDKATAQIMEQFYLNLMTNDVLNAMRLTRLYYAKNDVGVTALDMASWGVWM